MAVDYKKNKKALKKADAFTLVELLVVMSVTSLLMGIIIPCLGTAQKQCRATVCRSNIRQLFIANTAYAVTNDGFYVPAAHDLFVLDSGEVSSGGMHRWHGVRKSDGVDPDPLLNTFDPQKGPLRSYLEDGKVKECPSKVKYVKEGALDAFEAGCGGYGYNAVGIGSRTYYYGFSNRAMRSSMKISEIEQPSEKIMFTDAAFAKGFPPSHIIEYSFCEAPKAVLNLGTGVKEMGKMRPSIHFRHLGKSTVAWCDGHISAESFDFPPDKRAEQEEFKIGWFGPEDNSLFRPRSCF